MYRTKQTKPTKEQFTAYQSLYDFFNGKLFAGQLPSVLLNFSRRQGAAGFFSKNRWSKGATHTHEISINPVMLSASSFQEVCQTLVHEMCHLWQQEQGTPSRQGYHNHEWAAKMQAIGLMPSATGQEGGAKIGQRMSDYVIEGGPFALIFKAMPQRLSFPWKANEYGLPVQLPGDSAPVSGGPQEGQPGGGAPVAPKNKITYICRTCKTKVWGKPALQIKCIPCDCIMEGQGGA
jgi:predicted SprT family Zn-dependent metalloprotease